MESLAIEFNTALSSSPILALMLAFGGGLLTSLTPCVYPLIPITLGVIGVEKNNTWKRNTTMALSYSLGLALTYASFGAFSVLTGSMFGSLNSNPYIYLIVGNICILLGLSMFDLFYLDTSKYLGRFSSGKKEKSILHVFIGGVMSAFVAGPCTAPILGSVLIFASTKQSVFYGMSLLFSFALGLSVLLFTIALSSRFLTSLPKSGNWMVHIKKALGVIMIIAGEYFIFKAGGILGL